MTNANAQWRRRIVGAFVFSGLVIGSLAACAGGPLPAPAATGVEAATLEKIEGQEVSKITLTESASDRLGLTTEPVQPGPDGKLQVPYSALIYDASGGTWVYTSPEPLVFVRASVAVERIDASTVRLTSGPEPGTEIVTVGAAELLGAELDTAH